MSAKPQYPFSDGNALQAYFSPSGGTPKAGEFQSLCAVLCDAMGFKARPRLDTAGNPAGVDVKFAGQGGYCYCICRPPEEPIERKELQELLRQRPDIPASRTMIMTTGLFTPAAYEYATAIQIRAVGGNYLIGLLRQHGLLAEEPQETAPQVPPEPAPVRNLREERPVRPKVAVPLPPPRPKGKTRLAKLAGKDEIPSQHFDRASFFRNGGC